MAEIWRDVAGYEGLYQVSNIGRVRSSYKGGRILKLRLDSRGKGYLFVQLFRDGKYKHALVHRLVATAFISNPDNKPQVNHIDGNSRNNHVDNLEWCTPLENTQHAITLGLREIRSSRAKLTDEQARYIRENPDGLLQRELANKFGVSQEVISDVQLGKTYKNAGGHVRTEKLPDPKRTPDEVRDEIRRLYVYGSQEFGSVALAKKFGVSKPTILNIVNEN